MQLARIIGNAISTVRHRSFAGQKLLLAQPQDSKGDAGDPLLVIDQLGAGPGERVVISNDGSGARKIIGDDNSPVRWFVMGIVDEES